MHYLLKMLTASLAFCGIDHLTKGADFQRIDDSSIDINRLSPIAEPAAKAIYVSLTGSDNNMGTLSNPLRTVSMASRLASPGTTVYVEGGTYNEAIDISASGSAALSISFIPYNGQKVILDGAKLDSKKDVVNIHGDYINFRGFEVRDGRHGIVAYATHNVAIDGNLVYGNIYAGIWVGGDRVGQSVNNRIDNNIVHDNSLINQSRSLRAGWAQGISVSISDNTSIANNTVYNNYGEGIGAELSRDIAIKNNIVHDNYSVNIYLDNAPASVVDANFSYCSENATYFNKGHSAFGISAAIEENHFQLPLTGVVITNNIDVGCDVGFYYGDYGLGGGMQNTIIANNDFINETHSAIHLDYNGSSSGNIVANNIFYSNSVSMLASGSSKGFAFSKNDWYSVTRNGMSGESDIFADPMFSNPGSFVPKDYTLPAGSPAIGEGMSLPSVVHNFFGMSRSGPFNAGAI